MTEPRSEAFDPFEQLVRSHRRLEERLAELGETARAEDLDEVAVRAVSDFLGRQVRRHEEDEEQSLLPRLSKRAELADVMARIAREHVEQRELCAKLETLVSALEGGRHGADIRAELVRIADALATAYRAHIALEEGVLFPAAKGALDASDLAEMAGEMSSRRGGGGGGGGGWGGGGGRRIDRR